MSEDINQQILAELQGVASLGRRVFWLLLLLLIIALLGFPIFRHSRSASQIDAWDSVNKAMRQQDFQKALLEAHTLVAQQPNYYYGEAYLGVIYLAMGDVTNAEVHYSRAHELFPSDQTEKELAAVRKRMAQPPIKLLSQ